MKIVKGILLSILAGLMFTTAFFGIILIMLVLLKGIASMLLR